MNTLNSMPDDADVLLDSIRLMEKALKQAIEDKDTAAVMSWRRRIQQAQRELVSLLPPHQGG